jgi:hypothetical protein
VSGSVDFPDPHLFGIIGCVMSAAELFRLPNSNAICFSFRRADSVCQKCVNFRWVCVLFVLFAEKMELPVLHPKWKEYYLQNCD